MLTSILIAFASVLGVAIYTILRVRAKRCIAA